MNSTNEEDEVINNVNEPADEKEEVVEVNTHISGDYFEDAIIKYLIAEFKKAENIDLSKDEIGMKRIKQAAKKAAEDLTNNTETTVNLPFIAVGSEEPKHLEVSFTKEMINEFERNGMNTSTTDVSTEDEEVKLDDFIQLDKKQIKISLKTFIYFFAIVLLICALYILICLIDKTLSGIANYYDDSSSSYVIDETLPMEKEGVVLQYHDQGNVLIIDEYIGSKVRE